jgi:hypothetical protein
LLDAVVGVLTKHFFCSKDYTNNLKTVRCWVLGTGYWMLDTRCWVLGVLMKDFLYSQDYINKCEYFLVCQIKKKAPGKEPCGN